MIIFFLLIFPENSGFSLDFYTEICYYISVRKTPSYNGLVFVCFDNLKSDISPLALMVVLDREGKSFLFLFKQKKHPQKVRVLWVVSSNQFIEISFPDKFKK